ncbi:farnesylcysteine lyase-like [Pyrus x bretschneideri]|uniref:farnesylcysteine lyase-like n=1 Tax=Pyrus x bretschneideri TaxID=225117 RepID=UPI00202E5FD7|nr:farnesylcysteine lyase-like [Pyrus x bretschneideri]
MATVNISTHTFEAGASILHSRNLHALNYTNLLNLVVKSPSSSILRFKSKLPFADESVLVSNSLLMLFRYGFSLVRMDKVVEDLEGGEG